MNRDLIRIALALVTWGIGEGMFYLFQPLILQEMGADPQVIGNILGTVVAVMAVSYLPAGLLADRFGRRPLIYAAWIIATLATLLMAFAGSLQIYVAGMLLYGATGFVTVPLNSYITAARGQWSVGRTLTLISACFNTGAILGPLIGGWVAARAGLQTNLRIAGLIFILSSAVVLTIRAQPVEAPPPDQAGSKAGLRSLLEPRYLRFVVLMFLLIFGMYLSQPLAQNFLQNERGVDIENIGRLVSARSVGIVALSLLLGPLNARVGLIAAQAGMVLFNLLLWLGGGLPAYFAGYFLMGSYMVGRNLAIAQTRSLVRPESMGAAYGGLEMVMSTAMALGPPLAGYLYERQPEWMFIAALGLTGVGMAAYAWFSPVRRKDMQAFDEKERAEWAGS